MGDVDTGGYGPWNSLLSDSNSGDQYRVRRSGMR
ncbi:hypothetical protein A2U01_0072140, partial [Trifolium medium]|nr:hypothetical protein [Trifolium medium]